MEALVPLLLLFATPALAEQPSAVFNEIAWAGTTTSANDEWIELYNPTAQEVDVTGYKIVAADGSPSVTLKGMMLPYGFFLLERTDDATTPALADMLYTGALSNETEILRLYDASGTLIDEVAGWSAGDNETKQTMARDADGWKFGIPNGTPGAANIFSEPPSRNVTPPKKQAAKPSTVGQTSTPTPLVTEELPEAPPISASAIPITLKSEREAIPPVAGLIATLVAASGAAFFILPRVKRKDEDGPL